MKIYQLSEYGRQLTWTTWKSIGGCGLPNWANCYWRKGCTLGEIEDQRPAAGRSLARFAVDRLDMPIFSEERIWASNGEAHD